MNVRNIWCDRKHPQSNVDSGNTIKTGPKFLHCLLEQRNRTAGWTEQCSVLSSLMYNNTDFPHWLALASDLVVADSKPEHNFQRCFYAQWSVTETRLLQTPLSVCPQGRLRISYKAGIAICWPSREWALSTIYYYISLTKFGNGFEQRRRCHCQLSLPVGQKYVHTSPAHAGKGGEKL